MNDSIKGQSILLVPCCKCGSFNRVNIKFIVEPAKTIAEEDTRKKMQEELNANRTESITENKSECVRPNAPKGESTKGSTDNKPSDPTGKPINQGNKGDKK